MDLFQSQVESASIDSIGPDQLRIRPMTKADLPSILSIEHRSYSSPWNQEMFMGELTRNDYSNLIVAELPLDHRILAYACYWVLRGDLTVLNITVDQDFRRRGIGRFLMTWILQESKKKGAIQAFLEVRGSNVPAIHLYEQLGFRNIGIRPGYYRDPREDGRAMRLADL